MLERVELRARMGPFPAHDDSDGAGFSHTLTSAPSRMLPSASIVGVHERRTRVAIAVRTVSVTGQGGYGFHPLLAFLDNTNEALAGMLRRRSPTRGAVSRSWSAATIEDFLYDYPASTPAQ